MLNKEFKVFLCSGSALTAFGFAELSDILGMSFSDVLLNKYDAARVSAFMQKCTEVSDSAKPIKHIDSYGEAVFSKSETVLVVSIFDIPTGNADSTRINFLMNMSHEIRTPMNAIMGMGNLLGLTHLNGIQTHYLSNIVTAAESLLIVINNMLDLSDISENKFEPVNVDYDLVALLRAVVDNTAPKAAKKNLDFIVDIDPDIPSMLIGDSARISQILRCLLNNAVKFSEEGSVRLSLVGENKTNEEVQLKFCVQDTGVGIDKENEGGLFEVFAAMNKDRANAAEGTGLSLAISKNLAERLGGKLYLRSEPGTGAAFAFEIPQKVRGKEKIAYVRDFDKKKVLLLSFGDSGENYAKMLKMLFVEYDICYNETDFLKMLDKQTHTHIVYSDRQFRDIIAAHKGKLASKRIIAVKEAGATAFDVSGSINVILEPMLVTDLANVLDLHMNDDGVSTAQGKSVQNRMGSFQLKNSKILVVDDNEVNLIIAEEMLKVYGVEPDTAKSGPEAIDKAKEYTYDIILMDHMMPGMDGIEAAGLIRAECSENSKVPIISFTANSFPGMEDKFLANGMNDYITKPIDIDELNRVLKTWLPPEQIIYESSEEVYFKAHNEELFAKLSVIDGLEAYAALKEFDGNEIIYLAVLTTFVSTLPSKITKLVTSFTNRDMELYRIEVHSLKSSLANIGHYKLSEIAKRFEISLRNNQIDYIGKNHSKLIDDLKALNGQLAFAVSVNAEESYNQSLVPVNIRDEEDILNALKDGLDMLDTECVDSSMKKLKSLRLDKDSSGLFAGLIAHVNAFDYDSAVTMVDAFLNAERS